MGRTHDCVACVYLDRKAHSEPCITCFYHPSAPSFINRHTQPGGRDHRETKEPEMTQNIEAAEEAAEDAIATRVLADRLGTPERDADVSQAMDNLTTREAAYEALVEEEVEDDGFVTYDFPEEDAPASPAVQGDVLNPKDAIGSRKASIWSVMPRWVVLLAGRVMNVGAAKYGAFNYREAPIRASVYQDAMERHTQLWFDGEDIDPETGVSHLAHVMANCALLLDTQALGKLVDDRQKTGLVRETLGVIDELLETHPLPAPQY